ncbi:MAG: TonB-dependent receptor [Planctomycetaceae bacterium]|nr:TonB-dependent receptor [Planctomycetaceae bacterium]
MKITLRGFLYGGALAAVSASQVFASEPPESESVPAPGVARVTDHFVDLPIPPSGAVTEDSVGRVRIPQLLSASQAGQELTNAQLIETWSTDPEDVFLPVSLQEVAPVPVAPQQFQQIAPPPASTLSSRLFGSPSRNRSLIGENRRANAFSPGASVILGSESKGRKTTDVGSLLGRSTGALGVSTERRSPIVNDVRVRGSQVGQLLASGSYWFPVRQDLDTLLSKIDSSIIDDVIVIKGPYSSKYGPGYNFVDFQLSESPRYENGFESHGSTTLNYSTNGEQWYGRQSFWGGDADYGYRVGYGGRGGVDYETGDGVKLPSSYKSGNLDVALGFDLDDHRSLEFNYMRLDQADVQLPNQINTIDNLQTDSWELIYTVTNLDQVDRFTAETWYNTTELQGNAQDSGKRRQIPLLDETAFLNSMEGWNMSTGFNLSWTWNDGAGGDLTVGVDMRYLEQEYNERTQWGLFEGRGFMLGDPLTSPFQNSNFPLPRAMSSNPGLYLDHVNQVNEELVIRSGGRLDIVFMNADQGLNGAETFGESLETYINGADDTFRQHFQLGQAYVTANYAVDENVTLNGGVGFGMRAPTMAEMYSSGYFATVMPQFALTSPGGNSQLKAEKRTQIDIGFTAEYEKFRGGMNAYHAWIKDFITLDFAGTIRQGTTLVAPFYGYTNTDLATLAGFEGYAEHDLNDWFTTFGTVSFTEGRDHSRRGSNFPFTFSTATGRSNSSKGEEPLYAIYPLQARTGLRVTEPMDGRWGAEISARIVQQQDRVATSLLETQTPGFTTYDLRAFMQVSDNFLVTAGVENLTDKNYQEHLDPRNVTNVFQPGANYYLGAELTY